MRSVPNPGGPDLVLHDLGGEGPLVLMAHATGFHGRVWAPLAAALAARASCHSLDFRAHGASVQPAGAPLDWKGFGADVLAAVEALGTHPGELVGVGHSMGGAALVMAEQARPGTFRGLWLFEPIIPSGPMGAPGQPNPLAEGARRRRPSFPSRAEALANYASKPPLDRLRADALHEYVDHGLRIADDGAVHLACRPEDEARTFEGAGAQDTFARLGEVRCPVVVGRGDDGSPPSWLAGPIAEAIPGGRLEHLAGLGHFAPLEAPGVVAHRIAEFLAAVTGAA